MNREKIILSVIATIFGLLVAFFGFYVFKATKNEQPPTGKSVAISTPTPTPVPSIFLTVDEPKDEEVVDKKTLTVSGKTSQGAVITIVSDLSEDVITPEPDGSFSSKVTLEDGQNILEIIAISPSGDSMKVKKTVTYSLEDF